ncbi:MAG: hypothetical protein AAF363_12530 [Bacteroidota bacterium]
MIKKNFLRVALFTVFSIIEAYADSFIYLHRSSSSFETESPLTLRVNNSEVTTFLPGDWKLLRIKDRTQSLVINIDFPAGIKDDELEPCSFPRKLIPLSPNSVHFLTFGDEFCNAREVPKTRSSNSLRSFGLIKGFVLENREISELSDSETAELTSDLIGVDLEGSNPNLDNIDIDSLKELALEALKLRQRLAEKESAMKDQLLEYFELLKAVNQLDQNVSPIVHVGLENGGERGGRTIYNIRSSFSYDFLEDEGIKAELVHYPSGAYQLDKSAAAKATAFAMKKSVENYLTEYFEPGSTVKIRIIGSADAQAIGGALTYEGEYGNLLETRYYLADDYQIIVTENPIIDSTQVNEVRGEELLGMVAQPAEEIELGQQREVNLNENASFKENETLAYLRSYGIKNYVLNEIQALEKTKNEFIHQAKIEESIGGKYRKVVIELLIEDVVRNK